MASITNHSSDTSMKRFVANKCRGTSLLPSDLTPDACRVKAAQKMGVAPVTSTSVASYSESHAKALIEESDKKLGIATQPFPPIPPSDSSDMNVSANSSSSLLVRAGSETSTTKTSAAASAELASSEASTKSQPQSITLNLTQNLAKTYKRCNASFTYPEDDATRRLLSNPGEPAHNDGYDNEQYNLIMRVNDVLHSEEGPLQTYRVLSMLGQGTFGQVVKCEDCSTGRLVAVKVIKNKPAYSAQALVEIRLLKLLNEKHDPEDKAHILRMLTHFKYKNHLCLVFEMLSVNLYELLRQNHFRGVSMQLIRNSGAQLLEALVVLREAKVVHCDLKPENVLVCGLRNADIKVIDFGSACMESQPVYAYIQSRFYRAPEVLLGAGYDSAIDMWSVGCILAELFLGLPLFPGSSQYNQIARIVATLGMPPDAVLRRSANAHVYFSPRGQNDPIPVNCDGRESSFVLKSPETWSRENDASASMRQYVKGWLLADIIGQYPLRCEEGGKEASPEVREREMSARAKFLHLLQGLLRWDARERWSPWVALQHPFFTRGSLHNFDPAALHREETARLREKEKHDAALVLADRDKEKEKAKGKERKDADRGRSKDARAEREGNEADRQPHPADAHMALGQEKRMLKHEARHMVDAQERREAAAQEASAHEAAQAEQASAADAVAAAAVRAAKSLPASAGGPTPLAHLRIQPPSLCIPSPGHTPTSHPVAQSPSAATPSAASTPYNVPVPPQQQMLMTPHTYAQANRQTQLRLQAASGAAMTSPTSGYGTLPTPVAHAYALPLRGNGTVACATSNLMSPMTLPSAPPHATASAHGDAASRRQHPALPSAGPYAPLCLEADARFDAVPGAPVYVATNAAFDPVLHARAVAPYSVPPGPPLARTASQPHAHAYQRPPQALPLVQQPLVPQHYAHAHSGGHTPCAPADSGAYVPTAQVQAALAAQRSAAPRQPAPMLSAPRGGVSVAARPVSQQLPYAAHDNAGTGTGAGERVIVERLLARRERDRRRVDPRPASMNAVGELQSLPVAPVEHGYSSPRHHHNHVSRAPSSPQGVQSAPNSVASSVRSTPISPPRNTPGSPHRPSFSLGPASPRRAQAHPGTQPQSQPQPHAYAHAQSQASFSRAPTSRAARVLYSAPAPTSAGSPTSSPYGTSPAAPPRAP